LHQNRYRPVEARRAASTARLSPRLSESRLPSLTSAHCPPSLFSSLRRRHRSVAGQHTRVCPPTARSDGARRARACRSRYALARTRSDELLLTRIMMGGPRLGAFRGSAGWSNSVHGPDIGLAKLFEVVAASSDKSELEAGPLLPPPGPVGHPMIRVSQAANLDCE
jgi:hypothetical protein